MAPVKSRTIVTLVARSSSAARRSLATATAITEAGQPEQRPSWPHPTSSSGLTPGCMLVGVQVLLRRTLLAAIGPRGKWQAASALASKGRGPVSSTRCLPSRRRFPTDESCHELLQLHLRSPQQVRGIPHPLPATARVAPAFCTTNCPQFSAAPQMLCVSRLNMCYLTSRVQALRRSTHGYVIGMS